MTPNLRKPRSKRSTPAVDIESVHDDLEMDPSSMTASRQDPIPVSISHPFETDVDAAAPINASNANVSTTQATVVEEPSDETEPGRSDGQLRVQGLLILGDIFDDVVHGRDRVIFGEEELHIVVRTHRETDPRIEAFNQQ